MKTYYLVLIIALFFLTSGCYADMTGTVVDAETGKPIEGAVVLVEWTKTKGIGLTATESYKVVEVITDKGGKFSVSGVSNPFVNLPRFTVYKKDYVAWNNEYIFPTWEKRKDYKWENGMTIKMMSFKKDYSRADHVYFLHSITHWGKLMNEAYRWEELEKEKQQ